MKNLGILTLALTLSTPAFAWDARKACDILKAANDQQIATLEGASPYKEFVNAAQAIHKAMSTDSDFVRIQSTYTAALKDLTESDLTSIDKDQIKTLMETTLTNELNNTVLSRANAPLTNFAQTEISACSVGAEPVQNCVFNFTSFNFSLRGGVVTYNATLNVYLYNSGNRIPYSISINFNSGLITVTGPDSPEIAKLKNLEYLPKHCRQYYVVKK